MNLLPSSEKEKLRTSAVTFSLNETLKTNRQQLRYYFPFVYTNMHKCAILLKRLTLYNIVRTMNAMGSVTSKLTWKISATDDNYFICILFNFIIYALMQSIVVTSPYYCLPASSTRPSFSAKNTTHKDDFSARNL